MNNLTLMKKFTMLGSVFLVVVVIALGILVSSVSAVNRDSEEIALKAIPTISTGHELKLSVVQVQQWLTDISATRARDGLNDGFDEAANNAQRFKGLVAELSQLDPENRAQYQALLPTFDTYYSVGQKMAQAYIDEGPAGGNKMMAEFDGVAAAIAEQVDTLLQDISERSDKVLDHQSYNLERMQTMVFGSLLLLVGLAMLTFYIIYRAIRLLPLVVMELRNIAKGDLTGTKRIAENNDEIGWLCEGLGAMKSQLRELLNQVSSTSQQLSAAAEEMTAVAEETRSSIDRQQLEINQIATAMSEMSASSSEVAQNANLTSGSARDANDQANGGRQVVQESITSIRGLASDVSQAAEVITQLEQHSEDIGSILTVIRGIADQTNLLALNAAIEAARAGEQGRGFAVVADEVRTLASRTQQSTQEIQTMIEQLQAGTSNAVSVMGQGREKTESSVEQIVQAGGRLDSMTSAVSNITDMNLQIATAAEEQSKVAEEMARSINDISQVSEETALGAQHTADASQSLAELSLQLEALVGRFKI